MNYREAVKYIEEIPRFAEKHTVAHTRDFLRRLGDPQEGQQIIHVAGTNGKGSVCAYMQAMLMAEGKTVGFFTSPHLVSVNERIRINNRQIGNDAFLRAFLKVRQVVKGMEEEGIAHPSYFEFLFGMGMVVFGALCPDYTILETGLGGRLDATNSIERPILTVITSISMDHTQYLGDSIAAIAGEKAGIIKRGAPVICDANNPEALKVIREKAASVGTECREISDYAFEIREITDKHIAFSRINAYDNGITWKLKSCGVYQVMNAGIAVAALEYLWSKARRRKTGSVLAAAQAEAPYRKWRDALELAVWEGRMEEVLPGVFLDGAHNLGAVEAFVRSVKAAFLQGELPVILFSAAADKDYERMAAYLCRHLPAKVYIVTEMEGERKVSASALAGVFRKYTRRPVEAEPDMRKAWDKAVRKQAEGGRVFCLGSLYLVGKVKEWLAGGK